VLAGVPRSVFFDPRVLVGNETHDDAGVYQLSEDTALVQTVDFFTPVVDDPEIFGRVAATNSISDIYAMGGTPLTALNLLAAPADKLDADVIAKMLWGGQQVMDAHRTYVLGGHSIDDPEPKMGYAVTGIVHPRHIWRNSTASPGEWLYLTKPVGSGVVIKAIKDGIASSQETEAAVQMMTTSNRDAAEAVKATVGDPGACTDVTGFGLIGHVWEMAEGAAVAIELSLSQIPFLPGAVTYAESDRFPAGSRRNWEHFRPHVELALPDGPQVRLLGDAVTSGGLLFTVPDAKRLVIEEGFQARNLPLYRIGRVLEATPHIRLVP